MRKDLWVEKEIEILKKTDSDSIWLYDAVLSAYKTFHDKVMETKPENVTSEDVAKFESNMELAKHMFTAIFDGQPLSPLTGEDDEWEDKPVPHTQDDNEFIFRNKRYPQLMKRQKRQNDPDLSSSTKPTVILEENAEFYDHSRFMCMDANDHTIFRDSFIEAMLSAANPIEFPYMPYKHSTAIVNRFKLYNEVSKEKEPYDTMAIIGIIDPFEQINGVKIFFKLDGKTKEWVSINQQDYMSRLARFKVAEAKNKVSEDEKTMIADTIKKEQTEE